ncbi:MAG: glucuronate isomerase [Clostridiales bacterium]|nr:glucuronate isomerase [Clostridiales bacterium]
MKNFLDENFLLSNEISQALYHQHAKKMPIMDYHCHIDPQEIYEDRQYATITQVWLGGDHYKWRLMRAMGIEEKYITGNASDKDKFFAYAKTIEKAIGNPVYHWTHLELQRFFDFHLPLSSKTAQQAWDHCNEKLETLTVRKMILQSNVTHICTTDDPVSSLQWHEKLENDPIFPVSVLPAWRPDKAMNLEEEGYLSYLKELEIASNMDISSYDDFLKALTIRLDYFGDHFCKLSDHALEYVFYEPANPATISKIFTKRLQNLPLTGLEILQFKTAFLMFCAQEYVKRDWGMQIHYGALRNNNTAMFNQLGPDTGYDAICDHTSAKGLSAFFNALHQNNALPKVIVYSLNPNDNVTIDTLIGCFQGEGIPGKIQHGSAWWFNDHLLGMRQQMNSLATTSMLATFIGMLTDSRSFLSYPRHEYFRRLLCQLLGEIVADGQYPPDMEILGTIVEDICYNNAHRYFSFHEKTKQQE